MKHKNYIHCFVLIVVLCIVSCSSNSSPKTETTQQVLPSAPVENDTENGKLLFEEKCTVCHGSDGTAGIANAADLRKSKLDTISIIRAITNGKNAMPAFANQLGTGEIEQITAYVFTLRK